MGWDGEQGGGRRALAQHIALFPKRNQSGAAALLAVSALPSVAARMSLSSLYAAAA